ncbi:heterokaryon incompatibility protein-domain-containing protein [Fusarium tricinctum]|uniref:Heterokaryon incompatibility protein-domain-containing protein n=1 Tax=Fusarium tricinctum TaxID=61284 RepID=A0A8K0S7E9_9HYPO|nr:heterokaryon incompatibility protein-domain-containing protein [Fusarium tricinctum]
MMWIDQICINQEDNNEKSQQIPLMSRIYSLATSTVIWLAEASIGSDAALKLLEQIVSCLQFTFLNPDFEDLERLGLPVADSKQWKYLCELLSRQWFTRVWIIQEAVLSAAESTYFSCGDSFIRGRHWQRLACTSIHAVSRVSLGEAVENIANLKNSYVVYYVLFTFLTATRHAECSDPRDRAYGLLGICNDKKSAGVRVSYSSDYTAAGLYHDITVQYIRSDEPNPLLTLPLVLGVVEHESSDLPSWVPDWRVPPSMTALSAPVASSGIYDASGRFNHINNRGKTMATIRRNKLTTPGVFFDTIVNVSDIFVNPDLSYQNPMTLNTALCTSVAFASDIQNGPFKGCYL